MSFLQGEFGASSSSSTAALPTIEVIEEEEEEKLLTQPVTPRKRRGGPGSGPGGERRSRGANLYGPPRSRVPVEEVETEEEKQERMSAQRQVARRATAARAASIRQIPVIQSRLGGEVTIGHYSPFHPRFAWFYQAFFKVPYGANRTNEQDDKFHGCFAIMGFATRVVPQPSPLTLGRSVSSSSSSSSASKLVGEKVAVPYVIFWYQKTSDIISSIFISHTSVYVNNSITIESSIRFAMILMDFVSRRKRYLVTGWTVNLQDFSGLAAYLVRARWPISTFVLNTPHRALFQDSNPNHNLIANAVKRLAQTKQQGNAAQYQQFYRDLERTLNQLSVENDPDLQDTVRLGVSEAIKNQLHSVIDLLTIKLNREGSYYPINTVSAVFALPNQVVAASSSSSSSFSILPPLSTPILFGSSSSSSSSTSSLFPYSSYRPSNLSDRHHRYSRAL